jgi:hypothetical protein
LNRSIHAGSEVDDEDTTEEQDGADSCHPEKFEYIFNLEKADNRPAEENTDDKDAKDEPYTKATETEVSTNDSEPYTPASQDPTREPPVPEKTKSVRKKFHSDDPIYWYGILVPPSLRTAQKSFTEAIQSQVPDLAGTIVEMRALEQKITQVRAKLGVDTSQETRFEK